MVPRIRTVQIKNYKSLASVSVDLEPFTVLVGPNGSGKSNFIDALAFVQEALSGPLELALSRRGGFETVANAPHRAAVKRRVVAASPPEFDETVESDRYRVGLRLIVSLSGESEADYAFEISKGFLDRSGAFRVERERCLVRTGAMSSEFEIQGGQFTKEIPGIKPQIRADKLALFAASYTEEFGAVYDFLSSMRTYNIEPGRMRVPQEPSSHDCLSRDGSNAAAIVHAISEASGESNENVRFFLGCLVPGMRSVRREQLASRETLVFDQSFGDSRGAEFYPDNVSDGTLRILGILLAAYQEGYHPVVAIEEPEATVHPAAAETLMEVLTDAANERQILITTHSPDLLDYKDLKDDQIRVVNWHDGQTYIAPLSNATRQTIRERLYTPGELLSVDELNLNLKDAKDLSEKVDLFSEPFLGAGGGQ